MPHNEAPKQIGVTAHSPSYAAARIDRLQAMIDRGGAEADMDLARTRAARLIARVSVVWHSLRVQEAEQRIARYELPVQIPLQRSPSE